MTPPESSRLHLPLESGAEYVQCQQTPQREKENGESVVDAAPDNSQILDTHLLPTAQVSLPSNREDSGEAFQFFEEDSVVVPQSPQSSDLSDLSDMWTKSEGGRPVLFTFSPLEQGIVEDEPEDEPVETELPEIQQEIINTRSHICIRGLDNRRFLCYQNSVIQMLCASDNLRAKFLDHLDAMDGGLQSINSNRGTHRFDAPSCCADEKCFICALGWVVVNHRFCGYESGSIGSNAAPLNGWVRDFRTFSANLGYDGEKQQDASEYLMEIFNVMLSLGDFSKPIVDVLTGLYPSVVCCPKCNNQSVTEQELRTLQLYYPPTAVGPAEVEDLLDTLLRAEKVDSTCDACLYKSSDSSFLKIIRVNRVPSFLVLSVARYCDVSSPKLMGPLRIKEYLVLWSELGPVAYALKAVICHQGISMNSGHYTCFIQKPGQVWVSCDDRSIEEVSFEEIECLYHTQPVVLGYEKVSR